MFNIHILVFLQTHKTLWKVIFWDGSRK